MIESSCWLLSEKLGQTVAVFLPLCVAFAAVVAVNQPNLSVGQRKKKPLSLLRLALRDIRLRSRSAVKTFVKRFTVLLAKFRDAANGTEGKSIMGSHQQN